MSEHDCKDKHMDEFCHICVGRMEKEIERLTAADQRKALAIVLAQELIAEKDDRTKVLEDVLVDLQKFVDAQAKDAGLWCIASYASEAYIQNGLRGCHRYIEQAIAAADSGSQCREVKTDE